MFEWQKNINERKKTCAKNNISNPRRLLYCGGKLQISEEEESSDALMVKLDRDGTIPGSHSSAKALSYHKRRLFLLKMQTCQYRTFQHQLPKVFCNWLMLM